MCIMYSQLILCGTTAGTSVSTYCAHVHVTGFSEKDNLGRELFFPRIFFCSSLTRFSCSFLSLCLSSSIFLCSSTIANLSSAFRKTEIIKSWLILKYSVLKCNIQMWYIDRLRDSIRSNAITNYRSLMLQYRLITRSIICFLK